MCWRNFSYLECGHVEAERVPREDCIFNLPGDDAQWKNCSLATRDSRYIEGELCSNCQIHKDDEERALLEQEEETQRIVRATLEYNSRNGVVRGEHEPSRGSGIRESGNSSQAANASKKRGSDERQLDQRPASRPKPNHAAQAEQRQILNSPFQESPRIPRAVAESRERRSNHVLGGANDLSQQARRHPTPPDAPTIKIEEKFDLVTLGPTSSKSSTKMEKDTAEKNGFVTPALNRLVDPALPVRALPLSSSCSHPFNQPLASPANPGTPSASYEIMTLRSIAVGSVVDSINRRLIALEENILFLEREHWNAVTFNRDGVKSMDRAQVARSDQRFQRLGEDYRKELAEEVANAKADIIRAAEDAVIDLLDKVKTPQGAKQM